MAAVSAVRIGCGVRIVGVGAQFAAVVAVAVVKFRCIGGIGVGPGFVAVRAAVLAVGIFQPISFIRTAGTVGVVYAVGIVGTNGKCLGCKQDKQDGEYDSRHGGLQG